jgi:hypothetical protein
MNGIANAGKQEINSGTASRLCGSKFKAASHRQDARATITKQAGLTARLSRNLIL